MVDNWMDGVTDDITPRKDVRPVVNPAVGGQDNGSSGTSGNAVAPVSAPTGDHGGETRGLVGETRLGVDLAGRDVATENKAAVMGLDEQIRLLRESARRHRPETEEERRVRERKERSRKIVGAVSDGLRALGNLYFTSRYAPNMYDGKRDSMMRPTMEAIERARKEREADADRFLNYSLRIGDLERERGRTLRELEGERERRKLAREKAERDAEAHGWLAALQPDKQREQAGKANKAEQEAITAQAEAENAPAMQQAKLETEKARKGSYQASAANSRASAAAHGRSNVSEFSAWDERGKEHKFKTAAAAEAFARQHGTWNETDEEEKTTTETKRTPESKPQTRTSTKTKKGGYAGKPSPTGGKPSPTA